MTKRIIPHSIALETENRFILVWQYMYECVWICVNLSYMKKTLIKPSPIEPPPYPFIYLVTYNKGNELNLRCFPLMKNIFYHRFFAPYLPKILCSYDKIQRKNQLIKWIKWRRKNQPQWIEKNIAQHHKKTAINLLRVLSGKRKSNDFFVHSFLLILRSEKLTNAFLSPLKMCSKSNGIVLTYLCITLLERMNIEVQLNAHTTVSLIRESHAHIHTRIYIHITLDLVVTHGHKSLVVY